MVLWSYGTGNVGVGEGELAGPHMAEEDPFNPGQIVVGEQFGCNTLLIDRNTGQLKVLYGERGVAGGGDRLSESDSAHFMPSGPYKGHVLITEFAGEHRVIVIARDSGEVLWRYTGLEAPLDAIYWDDDHIMASDSPNGVFKIRISDQAKVWEYGLEPHANPFYLHKISTEHNASYGGDLLIGYYGVDVGHVREIDTASKETVWKYGDSKEQGYGDLYDRLRTPVRALRYGIDENLGGLTIICDERSRILFVNRDKELVWELGGGSGGQGMTATQHMISPTYVSVTRKRTLLITDWGRNMVYEISPFDIPAAIFQMVLVRVPLGHSTILLQFCVNLLPLDRRIGTISRLFPWSKADCYSLVMSMPSPGAAVPTAARVRPYIIPFRNPRCSAIFIAVTFCYACAAT